MSLPVFRYKDIETFDSKVMAVMEAKETKILGVKTFLIEAPSAICGRKSRTLIATKKPKTIEEQQLMEEAELALYEKNQTLYKDAVGWGTEQLLDIAFDHLFEKDMIRDVSRMDDNFAINIASRPDDIVLGEIARGGTFPTEVARRFIERHFHRQVPYLYANAQRIGDKENMSVIVDVKGQTNLEGRDLTIIEQAVATVTTLPAVARKWMETCRSRPKRINLLTFHTTKESLETVQKIPLSVPESDPLFGIPINVIALLVHAGINDKGYIIGPGCADVGEMLAAAPDVREDTTYISIPSVTVPEELSVQ